jgi:hypothetical protein
MPDGKNNAGVMRLTQLRVIQSGGHRLSMVYSLPLRHSLLGGYLRSRMTKQLDFCRMIL